MEAKRETILENQLEMHREWVNEMRKNRKYYILGGFLIGVGFWGLVTMYFN
tara:strand:- start:1342 stop:1494 length:153 start_codon:yes stop_codon:yes gene_type:complete